MTALILFVLATAFSVNQGSVAFITFPEEAHVKSMELRWDDKKVPFAHVEGKWETVVGVDLDTKSGDHEGVVEVRFDDGRIEQRPIVLSIAAVKFPTTELKVEDQ